MESQLVVAFLFISVSYKFLGGLFPDFSVLLNLIVLHSFSRFCDTYVIPRVIPVNYLKHNMVNNYPTVRLLFDRKHLASPTRTGVVEIEISFQRKRKMVVNRSVNTGIRRRKSLDLRMHWI